MAFAWFFSGSHRNGLLGRVVVASLFVALTVGGGASPSALAQSPDSTELRRFQRANDYLRSGQTEDAIELLEPLYQQNPDNQAFYQKLKEAYQNAKQYEKAIGLLDDRIDNGATPALLSEKARLLYQSGQQERASTVWTDALELRPNDVSAYRVVYQTLMDLRRFNRAIDILTRARSALDRPDLFRTDLAYLYSLDGQHAEAMEEYVALLSGSPDRANYVRGRLRPFVDRGEGLSAGISVLQNAVEEAPRNPALRRVLAWLHMENDEYAAAFEVYRGLDRLEEQQGRRLVSFAEQAADAEQYDVATQAYQTVLDRYPETGVAPRARRGLGDMYRQWADQGAESPALIDTTSARAQRYDAARAAYRTFLTNHPTHDDAPAVQAKLGTLQLDVYRQLGQAASIFRLIRQEAADTPAAQEAEFNLARIALLRGNLDRARLLFSRLADELSGGDLANEARYELARLHFYQGAFDDALTQAETVTVNTSADVANDAIDLNVLIQENRGPDSLDSALRLYARAQFADRKRDYAVAASRLDSLIQTHGRHSLADNARFDRAQIHEATGDTTAALQAYEALAQRHPQSPYSDRSLFRQAQLQEAQGHLDAATATYDRLLTNYPESLLAGDARDRLRALRRRQG